MKEIELGNRLIETAAQYLPAKGMTQLVQTIGKVRRNINPDLKIEGILMTLVYGRTNLSREIQNLLIRQYGNAIRIYETKIPSAVKAAETGIKGISIFAYDEKGRVAEAYRKLTKEVIEDGGKKRSKNRTAFVR